MPHKVNSIKCRELLKENFPVFHSRAMWREFVCLFGKLTSTKPVFLREIYRRLTGDQSFSANAKEKAIDDRLKLMIEYEDPDLILDL